MGSEQNRFPHQREPPAPRHKRWGKCWGGMSCFGTQKGGKRVVPASRIPEANALANQPNGQQAVGLANQTTSIAPSLLAPPSSPASFSNSALPSTVQSPNCFLSANSPGGPSSNMYATGPYAHETQLVSPPVFSTFTTEPSTAPFTPPPELAHLTTPSSPDVPFAQFLSSSKRGTNKRERDYMAANDLQSTYSLYPGSPASSLRSPVSRTSGERDFTPHNDDEMSNNQYGLDTASASKFSQDSNFFCPATFAQFYLDNSSFPHSGGRLSVSKESDVYSNTGNVNQNRQQSNVEELEAYRASFGFSADEIITTPQYVEISDVMEDSFTMLPPPPPPLKVHVEETPIAGKMHTNLATPRNCKSDGTEVARCEGPGSCNGFEDHASQRQQQPNGTSHILSSDDEEDRFKKMMGSSRTSRKYKMGLSSSDAEVDYRRGRSLREGKGDFAWHD